jgi:hypothetical protein
MQSLEASISLLVFLSLSSAFVLQLAPPRPPDDSLYRMQLADDAWRVLSLRGHFTDFSEEKRGGIEADMRAIGDEASLCIFMQGMNFTNCRDGREHLITASLSRVVVWNGTPKRVTFSMGVAR